MARGLPHHQMPPSTPTSSQIRLPLRPIPTSHNRCPALAWENYQWHPANRSLSTMLGSLYRTLQMHDARRGARMRTSRGARCYLLGHLRPIYAVACSAYVVYR